MDIDDYLQAKRDTIEKALDTFVSVKDVTHSQLYQAARYSLLGGGKRLRPILALAAAEAYGAPEQYALSTACALEMIHTYSLIHDDLPCMDNDDFRRGKPSLHKAYNEGHAVLTGDYLLTKAFEVVSDDPHLDPLKKIELIQQLSKGSGCQGMVAGQVLDIEAEGKLIDLASLQRIHHYKTGALIQTSILCGAIIGNATIKERECLSAFGKEIGLAFQIVDDLLDVISIQEKRGGHVASDSANKKTTYVTLLGVDGSKQAAEGLLQSALGHLESSGLNFNNLRQIALRLVRRQK